jgi:hypothetical protein
VPVARLEAPSRLERESLELGAVSEERRRDGVRDAGGHGEILSADRGPGDANGRVLESETVET